MTATASAIYRPYMTRETMLGLWHRCRAAELERSAQMRTRAAGAPALSPVMIPVEYRIGSEDESFTASMHPAEADVLVGLVVKARFEMLPHMTDPRSGRVIRVPRPRALAVLVEGGTVNFSMSDHLSGRNIARTPLKNGRYFELLQPIAGRDLPIKAAGVIETLDDTALGRRLRAACTHEQIVKLLS